MARVSFTDLSSDDLNSSDESIFSDASYSDEEISYGKTKGWVFFKQNQISLENSILRLIKNPDRKSGPRTGPTNLGTVRSSMLIIYELKRLFKEKMVKMMNDYWEWRIRQMI